jgi:hypothetical protein
MDANYIGSPGRASHEWTDPLSGRQFMPSAQTESLLTQKIPQTQKTKKKRQQVPEVKSYITKNKKY